MPRGTGAVNCLVLHTYKQYHRFQTPGGLNNKTSQLPLVSAQQYNRLQAILPPACSRFEPAGESVSCPRCLIIAILQATNIQMTASSHHTPWPLVTAAKSVQMVHNLRSNRGPLALELCSEQGQKQDDGTDAR